MEIHKNFYQDWIGMLKNILIKDWGYESEEVNNVADDKLPIKYFNAQQRRIETANRTIKYSDAFQCPSELNDGWELLKNKIETGADISKHLSKDVSLIDETDSMLNDWKIHHFHLGTVIKKGYIKRTGPLLFAYVTDDTVYIVNIFNHGQWVNTDIIEIIHRNWPELIASSQVDESLKEVDELTTQERKQLRKKNCNAFVTVSDGTVYAPIGGGITASGHNVHSAMNTLQQKRLLSNLEEVLDNSFDNISSKLADCGYDGDSDLNARLVIENNSYYAFFEEYNFCVQFRD